MDYEHKQMVDDVIRACCEMRLMSASSIAKSPRGEGGKAVGPVLLSDHLHHVAEMFANTVYREKRFMFERCRPGFNALEAGVRAAAYHDVGKGFRVWQDAARNGTLHLGEVRHELIYLPRFEY